MAILLMSKTTSETRVEEYFFQSCGVPSSIAFIPAKTDPQKVYYSKIKNHYAALGVKDVLYCDLDAEFKASVFEKISSCESMYLAGGLTPYFLQVLQKRNAFELIREFAQNKKVIGVSAGALVLGKDINILSDDPGEGYSTKALRDSAGVGLYDFDFWPHYGKHESDERRFTARSVKRDRKVVGCDDHSGLIVRGKDVEVVGIATVFYQGQKSVLKNAEHFSIV